MRGEYKTHLSKQSRDSERVRWIEPLNNTSLSYTSPSLHKQTNSLLILVLIYITPATDIKKNIQKVFKRYWKSIEKLLKKHWKNIEKVLKKYWNNIEIVLKKYWKSIEKVEKSIQKVLKKLEKVCKKYWNSIQEVLK